MKNPIWFLSLILVSSRLLAVDVSPYIVNGSNANIVNYPSFASLFYRNGNTYSTSSYCGATMINSQYALTAAHCIYGNESTMLYTVVVPQLEDETNFLSTQQAKAEEFYYPDDYIDSGSELWPNDIAIIKLESPLSVSDYTSLLNTTLNNNFPNSADYKAIGHGLIEGGGNGTQLLETSLDYISLASCQTQYSKVTDKQICFGGPQIGSYQNSTCNGDSGGPVYWFNGVQYIQIGITSFGPSTCGDPSLNVTSVFTDVYDYIGWINNVINGQITPKYYVTTVNGNRVLNSNVNGISVTATSGGSSGGSLHYAALLMMIVIYCRRKLTSAH
ncbi:trypsin-like serine protease [Vibrio coralliilyticus OCN008]|uniref:S1 family peptidase n=1 Tax=Vibrio coralliilyticus TaxID=190893 RepID=UPI0003912420|nr:trypsin-like serine protease [Vibrio coralliilyticus]ERB64300.1 serine protease [Vibrio coralliilyticus OCN008]QIJ86225.1 trypsin-like serine protease [Vibrio coralliilyticus OCN008]